SFHSWIARDRPATAHVVVRPPRHDSRPQDHAVVQRIAARYAMRECHLPAVVVRTMRERSRCDTEGRQGRDELSAIDAHLPSIVLRHCSVMTVCLQIDTNPGVNCDE